MFQGKNCLERRSKIGLNAIEILHPWFSFGRSNRAQPLAIKANNETETIAGEEQRKSRRRTPLDVSINCQLSEALRRCSDFPASPGHDRQLPHGITPGANHAGWWLRDADQQWMSAWTAIICGVTVPQAEQQRQRGRLHPGLSARVQRQHSRLRRQLSQPADVLARLDISRARGAARWRRRTRRSAGG